MNGYLTPPGGPDVPVADGLTIGRVKGCELVLDDPKASRQHARLIVESSVVEIEDLDSSNGTLVNGKLIQRRMLRSGDVIQIGTSLITYREEHAETAVTDSRARSDPAPAPRKDVIEFVDERVEVKTITRRGSGLEPSARGRRSIKGGVLRDDLRQMGGWQRMFVVVASVMLAAAVGYAAFRIAISS